MLVMLATALVGDLILLPALLAGPAGKWFKPRTDANGRPINSAAGQLDEIDPSATSSKGSDLSTGDRSDVADSSSEERESLTHLKIHFSDDRKDPAHRLKGK
jgi:hypothetical protein